MLSFLASSTFFKYAQNAGFAFKKFKIFMGGGMPPNPPSMFGPVCGPHRSYLGPWGPLWTRPTCLVFYHYDFYSASSPKQQSADRHVTLLGHVILIPSQPVFLLNAAWLEEKQQKIQML
jgi:hypothetical protein